MSLRVQCDGCREYGYETSAGTASDMPNGWVAVRFTNRAEHHYCSATCLLGSFVLPGVWRQIDPFGVESYRTGPYL